MYIYHPSDKPDRIPIDQLEPVGKAFAEIVLEAAAGTGKVNQNSKEKKGTEEFSKGISNTVKEILSNEEAVRIIEKYAPGLTKDPRIDMAMGMKLKSVAPFVGSKLNREVLAAIDKELKEL